MIKISSVSATVIAIALTSQAQAQDTNQNTTTSVQPESTGLDDTVIQVTGSRIVKDGTKAPTPQTVIGEQQLHEQGITRLIDFARNVPALKDAGGSRRGNNGFLYGGQGSLNMRSLGANRNLILLDRRRVSPSTATGVVDVNTLPSALVKRVDVVTGGASAAWGSDAISGVVNFVLDTNFEGLKVDLSGGISSHGDNGEQSLSAAGGIKIGERGRLIGSIEYFHGSGQPALSRDFLSDKPGIVNNPAWTATNGQPRFILASQGIVTSYMTRSGIINGGRNQNGTANNSLRGTAFDANGNPYAFQYGTYVSPTGNMIAPQGANIINTEYTSIYDGVLPTSPSRRISGFAHFEYDLTDNVKAFVEGTLAKNRTNYVGVAPYRFGTSATSWLSITADNPYLSPAVRANMSGPGGGNPAGPYYLNVGRMNDDLAGYAKVINSNTFGRVVAGLEGDFGKSWKWNAYYQYGQNKYDTSYGKQFITSRGGVTAAGNVNLAVDAVIAPAGNSAGIAAGTIVCRSTLTNPNNGCQPLNLFGLGKASQAAIDYATGTAHLNSLYKQHVVEGSVQGELLNLWAGPAVVALGGSYRFESINVQTDALSRELAFGVVNPLPSSGNYSVKEAFAELSLPLARDWRFAKALDVDVAARITDYSGSGTVKTWKAGATYTPFNGLRLRATRSLDIRAPSLDELYRGGSQSRVAVTDTPMGSASQINILQITGGNPNLTPETADTLSYGLVIQPDFLPGLSLSADRYDIKISNVISTISAQETLNRCAGGNSVICGLVTRQGGTITTIATQFQNLALLSTQGYDFELSYQRDVSNWFDGREASLGARFLANYVENFKTSDGRTTIEQAGSIADIQPKLSIFASYYFKFDSAQITVTNNFVGSGSIRKLYDVDPLQKIDNNRVKSKIYTNLNLSFDIDSLNSKYQLFFNVDNLFNVKPPKGFGFGYGLNAVPLYDVVGTMFKTGVRIRY